MELVTNEWHEKSPQMLCEVVAALRSLLTGSGMQEQMQRVMVDNQLLDILITIIEESVVGICVCILRHTVSAVDVRYGETQIPEVITVFLGDQGPTDSGGNRGHPNGRHIP
jgi:hypothetical protein